MGVPKVERRLIGCHRTHWDSLQIDRSCVSTMHHQGMIWRQLGPDFIVTHTHVHVFSFWCVGVLSETLLLWHILAFFFAFLLLFFRKSFHSYLGTQTVCLRIVFFYKCQWFFTSFWTVFFVLSFTKDISSMLLLAYLFFQILLLARVYRNHRSKEKMNQLTAVARTAVHSLLSWIGIKQTELHPT